MQHTQQPILHTVTDVFGIYSDAVLTDGGRLLFGSFWGRDTASQEFLARLQLSQKEGGLTSFEVNGVPVYPGRADDLAKLTGRVLSPIFGKLVHLWIYDPLLTQPDISGRQAVLLLAGDVVTPQSPESSILNDRGLLGGVWTALKTVCPLPLLDHPRWQAFLVNHWCEQGWIMALPGIGVSGIKISLPEEYEAFLSTHIRSGDLPLEGGAV